MGTAKMEDLLEMLRVMQVAKDAVTGFESGEMNLREAVELIREASASLRAA